MKAKQIAAIVVAVIVAGACTKSDNITKVEPPPDDHAPVAKIDGSTSSVEGSEVSFSAKSSTDPDGDPLRYQWTFGDAGADSGDVVKHIYADNGSETVRLVVRDTQGLADTAALTVTVANAPPQIASITAPTSAVALPDSVKIDVVVSDPGKADSLTVSFDWGDGKKNTVPKTHGAHKYGTVGHYTVQVTVTDDDGASASKTAAIEVRAAPQLVHGYEVIDLGTLGGESARPYGLNDNDAVVGASTTSNGELHAFLWKEGSIRDLAVGFPESRAEKITRDGLIAGVGIMAENRGAQVFEWKNGVTTNLGLVGIAGGPQVKITGALGNDVLAWHESEMDRFTSAIWRSGARQSIGGLYSPSSDEAEATGMNDSRQVVGASLMHGGHSDIYHAFIWENGTTRDLGVLQEFTCDLNGDYPNCGNSRANDINDKGDVVGTSWDSDFRQHAVLWVDGVVHDLGLGIALTINDAGDIAGNSSDPGHGYFWRDGTRTDIGSLGGATFVAGMNGQSTLVGTSVAAEGRLHVFVWQPGQSTVTDLGTGPSNVRSAGAVAVAINTRGDVIGYTCDKFVEGTQFCALDAKTHAILWKRRG